MLKYPGWYPATFGGGEETNFQVTQPPGSSPLFGLLGYAPASMATKYSTIKKRPTGALRAPRLPRASHATKAGQDRAPTIEEIARGMLSRYSSARVAMEMAHWHAMDHAEGSPSRARWLRVRETIDRLSRKDR